VCWAGPFNRRLSVMLHEIRVLLSPTIAEISPRTWRMSFKWDRIFHCYEQSIPPDYRIDIFAVLEVLTAKFKNRSNKMNIEIRRSYSKLN
jgi:hypothetical protein